MKLNNLKELREQSYHETYGKGDLDFSIKSQLEFLPGEYIEVSNMFLDKKEMEEAGIMYGDRIITAYTKSGYQQLKQMGFSHKEIIKSYGNY